jgi:ABC-2 type transport system ATP-binding protein
MSDGVLPGTDAPVGVAEAPATGAAEPAQPLLALDGVSKRWPRAKAPVLDDVDLELERGDCCWIGGRNGVGKTTLMRIAAGLIFPDSGLVTLDGTLHPRRDSQAFKRRIAFLTAGDRGLYARLNCVQHLDYWARLSLMERDKRKPAIDKAIERFRLAELAKHRVDRMSMGQRQRVRLAMTFLHEPEVVLLDEPRNSLDDEGIDTLVRAVDEVVQAGGAILWCSPAGEPVPYTFNHRYQLVDGKLETL